MAGSNARGLGHAFCNKQIDIVDIAVDIAARSPMQKIVSQTARRFLPMRGR